MTRLGFPITRWDERRLGGNVFYAVGTENFAQVDQIGRFSSHTYGGGLRFQLTARGGRDGLRSLSKANARPAANKFWIYLWFPLFETFRRLGPAAFVLKAIISVIVADVLLLGFIMLRRTYRRRYFAKRDGRLFEFRERWDALISGEIPYATWRTKTIRPAACRDHGIGRV